MGQSLVHVRPELCFCDVERAKLSGKALGLTGFDISEHPESHGSSADVRKAEGGRAFRSSLAEGVIATLGPDAPENWVYPDSIFCIDPVSAAGLAV